jgi:spore coat polysaccharide biosynthesis protein SpsF
MRVAAIIQARMTSTRFPGKVLKPLAGKPVIWHIIHRLRKCKTVDTIVLATSTNREDDPLAAFADAEGIAIFRGSEHHVLERYYLAAKQVEADIVVRVTGDAPLIDPPWLDYLVETLQTEQVDRVERDKSVPCIHEGFSPLTFKILEKLYLEVGNDPVAKEHVTGYLGKNPSFAISATVTPEPSCQFAGARMSVDTPADLQFMEELYRLSGAEPGELDISSAVTLLRSNPELLKINSHIYQKKASDTARQVLFRCDADERIGFGHLFRCIALADELRAQHGCGITFAMASGIRAKGILGEEGYRVIDIKLTDETAELDRVITDLQPCALVFDLLTPIEPDAIAKWRKKGLVTATIDDPTPIRISVDLAFYPPVPQVKELSWEGFTGELYSGWEWVVLRRQFAALTKEPRNNNQATNILITMGGSDSLNMTGFVLEALREVKTNCYLNVEILLGPTFNNEEELNKTLESYPHQYGTHQNITEPVNLFHRADLAIASFGVTAYELAACGTPAILLCLTEDHSISASVFDKAGIAVNLGLFENTSRTVLANTVSDLLEANSRLITMAALSKKLVDAKGTARIAETIIKEVNRKNVCA